MRSENQELTSLLHSALINAERIFETKTARLSNYDYNTTNNQTLFKTWAWSFWGIELGEKRTNVTYPPGKAISRYDYWSVISVKDEEQMVMFKLKYG